MHQVIKHKSTRKIKTKQTSCETHHSSLNGTHAKLLPWFILAPQAHFPKLESIDSDNFMVVVGTVHPVHTRSHISLMSHTTLMIHQLVLPQELTIARLGRTIISSGIRVVRERVTVTIAATREI
jgi:hypothetical protein